MRREDVAVRMAEAVVKRLTGRRLLEIRDEAQAREVVRRIVAENLQTEEKIEAEARELLSAKAKEFRDSAYDYGRLLTLVKTKLARERGFTL
jgi:hypothetical protein